MTEKLNAHQVMLTFHGRLIIPHLVWVYVCLFRDPKILSLSISTTYLCLGGSSTINLWTNSFRCKECLVIFLLLPYIIEIPFLNANGVDPDTLIWVYTVRNCPFYGTLGINGLMIFRNTILVCCPLTHYNIKKTYKKGTYAVIIL